MDNHHIIDAGGIRLAYRMAGHPDAPPLVLLHALGEDGSDWDEVAADLAGSWRVYAPDLRGHGRSDWPGDYSVELMRDDVIGFLDALDLDAVTLVGHSMGGTVAYLIAKEHPQRVRRLVLEDSPPPFPRDPRPMPERPDHPLPFDWPVVPAIRREIEDPDPAWSDGIEKITASTLIIGGGPDSHVPQDKLAAASDRIPDCRMVTIPSGHHVHTARPADFLAELTSFLAERTR